MKDNEQDFTSAREDLSPPLNSLRVGGWHQLPNKTAAAIYRVTDPGQEPRDIIVSKNQRRVLDGLIRQPIYAASFCRISDQVSPLRHDHGVDIECKTYRNDPETGRKTYGVYFLKSQVQLIGEKAV